MPVRDKYHNNVVRAFEEDGWQVLDDPYTILLSERRLYVDLLVRRGDETAVLVEVKVFEDTASPMTYLANAVGQYLLYKAALDFLEQEIPLYLAIPKQVYDTLFVETLAEHYIRYTKTKLMIYNPIDEEIVEWII